MGYFTIVNRAIWSGRILISLLIHDLTFSRENSGILMSQSYNMYYRVPNHKEDFLICNLWDEKHGYFEISDHFLKIQFSTIYLRPLTGFYINSFCLKTTLTKWLLIFFQISQMNWQNQILAFFIILSKMFQNDSQWLQKWPTRMLEELYNLNIWNLNGFWDFEISFVMIYYYNIHFFVFGISNTRGQNIEL